MNQSWHPGDSDWREGSEEDNLADSPCALLDRSFVVSVIYPQKSSEVVPHQPHVILCSAYDADEEFEE